MASDDQADAEDERDEERVLVRDAAQPRLHLRDLLGGGGLGVGDPLGRGVARVADPLDRGVAALAHRLDRGVAPLAHRLDGRIAALVEALSRGHSRQSLAQPALWRSDTLHLASGARRKTLVLVESSVDGLSALPPADPGAREPSRPRAARHPAPARRAPTAATASPPSSAASAEPLFVRKRDGERQRFDRTKLRAALLRSTHKRQVGADDVEALVDRVELAIETGGGELAAERIGELCLEGLRELDHGAYLQFLGTLPAPGERRMPDFAESASSGSVRGAARECIVTR